jgi:O-methyltransferase involved in polyketide biosynthesis
MIITEKDRLMAAPLAADAIVLLIDEVLWKPGTKSSARLDGVVRATMMFKDAMLDGTATRQDLAAKCGAVIAAIDCVHHTDWQDGFAAENTVTWLCEAATYLLGAKAVREAVKGTALRIDEGSAYAVVEDAYRDARNAIRHIVRDMEDAANDAADESNSVR